MTLVAGMRLRNVTGCDVKNYFVLANSFLCLSIGLPAHSSQYDRPQFDLQQVGLD